MLAFDKNIPFVGLYACMLRCNGPVLTMRQFVSMRWRANLLRRLIPVFRLIMHFGSGAASCVGIGFTSNRFGSRGRRCGIEEVAYS